MKNKQKYTGVLVAALTATPALWAQQPNQNDSTYTREMLIEKQYNPIVRDADKIMRLPEVEEPLVVKSDVSFAEPTLRTTPQAELNPIAVGDVNNAYDFDHKKGYLRFGGGNYLNLHGDLGYRFIDTDRSVLGAYIQHVSTHGKVKYPNDLGKVQRDLSESQMKLYYAQQFDKLSLQTDFSYQHNRFNFYGLPQLLDHINPAAFQLPQSPDQKENLITYHLALATKRAQKWNYHADFDFRSYSNHMPGIKEHNIDLLMGVSKHFRGNWQMQADVYANTFFYGGADKAFAWDTKEHFDNMALFGLRPRFNYTNDNLDVRLGVKVDMSAGVSPHFTVAPDVAMQWQMADHWLIYSDLVGGMKQNSVMQVAQNYHYRQYFSQLKNSYEAANFQLGIRTDIAPGLGVDLYGGAAYTKNALLMHTYLSTTTVGEDPVAINALYADQANLTSYRAGMKIGYKYADLFGINLDGQFNKYNFSDRAVASYMPGAEIASSVFVKPLERWQFTLAYQGAYHRKAFVKQDLQVDQQIDADNLHFLNLEADWLMSRSFKVYAHLNNLLFRKQAIYYGMPEQGFHFVLGGTLLF